VTCRLARIHNNAESTLGDPDAQLEGGLVPLSLSVSLFFFSLLQPTPVLGWGLIRYLSYRRRSRHLLVLVSTRIAPESRYNVHAMAGEARGVSRCRGHKDIRASKVPDASKKAGRGGDSAICPIRDRFYGSLRSANRSSVSLAPSQPRRHVVAPR